MKKSHVILDWNEINSKLEKIKNMQHVIGIAGGGHKIEAIKGALLGGYIHSLITDERTAAGLLAQE